MSNSTLINYTKLSPNHSGRRTHAIDTVSIHCMAGNLSVESCGAMFAKSSTKASSNYGIGSDGRIALYVDEANRSWCTSNSANDNRAVTIEVANTDNKEPYPVSDAAYESLIRLLVDICQRNGIEKLVWKNDKASRVNHLGGANMTVHRDYANKSCVPTYSEVLTRDGWVKLSDVEIGDEIACADIDNLQITFEEVYDKVPVKKQDTYTNNELTATKDHRMVYRTQSNLSWRIDEYRYLLKSGNNIYIPLAGYGHFDGLPLTNEMIAFYVAVQADGHYMYEITATGEKHYYGLEFHLKKQRKIDRLLKILDGIHVSYSITVQSNGSTKVRIYNHDGLNIVNDICERYLHDKCFTWEWLNLSPEQAVLFLTELLNWDGCSTANSYCSQQTVNLDIVNAIAALNGVGSRILGSNVQFRSTPYITLGENTKRNTCQHGGRKVEVSCVSVKTGMFLMRQDGKTFIVGNCPGQWLYEHHGQIADEVNARLAGTVVETLPSSVALGIVEITGRYKVDTQSSPLNCRDTPGGAVIGAFAIAEIVEASYECGDWLYVTNGSLTGWASAKYLTLLAEDKQETKQEQETDEPKEDENEMDISKLTDEQCYAIIERAQHYAAKLPLPMSWDAEGALQRAIDHGVTDGTLPMTFTTRLEAAVMADRATHGR